MGREQYRNGYLTICSVCRFGIYTGQAAVWQRGTRLGMSHATCADGADADGADAGAAVDTTRVTSASRGTRDLA